MTIDRRHFLFLTGSLVGAECAQAATRGPFETLEAAPQGVGGTDAAPLVRMQQDLQRALAKPVEQRSWAMAVDVRKCIGCRACVIACKAEHVSPPGVSYRQVSETEEGEYPEVERIFMPSNCMHCAEPPCKAAAPEGAITKRPDGIVVFHPEKLSGKPLHEKLVAACPYNVLSYDEGKHYTDPPLERQPYETIPSQDYGKPASSAVSTTRKCDFCLHRLESGALPACVTTCIGHAMFFGDRSDTSSLVSEVIREGVVVQINEPEKQKPRVFHLASDKESCARCH